MKRGIRNGLVAGWMVLAAGGWGLTQWLGEPSATEGPAPGTSRTPDPASIGGPGPQPENECGAPDPFLAASPLPTATAFLTATAVPHDRQVVCTRIKARRPAGWDGD
ncbi:hypothetical protein [Streptomyces sp. NBC_01217]|uniref:hypothetical protein n=1 Tax=Streptomyces sp. NBC_01217 TaxID=2903779 RepID=UPI002E117D9C|nr:hypothetical protein OG507_25315 [Streptomyces sp. NBC_01217]